MLLFIYNNVNHLLLGTSSKVYMCSSFAACAKKISSRINKNLLSLRIRFF